MADIISVTKNIDALNGFPLASAPGFSRTFGRVAGGEKFIGFRPVKEVFMQ